MSATAKVEQIQAQIDALNSTTDPKVKARIYEELAMYVDQRQRLLAQMEKS